MELHEEQNKATLKTLHFAVGTICDAVAVKHGKNASKMLIYAINKVAVGSLEALSTDLEHFAKHAKRKVINSDDVYLSARRNESLLKVLHEHSESISVTKSKKRVVVSPVNSPRASRLPAASICVPQEELLLPRYEPINLNNVPDIIDLGDDDDFE